jgi:hypothetical protein
VSSFLFPTRKLELTGDPHPGNEQVDNCKGDKTKSKQKHTSFLICIRSAWSVKTNLVNLMIVVNIMKTMKEKIIVAKTATVNIKEICQAFQQP